jgi:hypothetical protein
MRRLVVLAFLATMVAGCASGDAAANPASAGSDSGANSDATAAVDAGWMSLAYPGSGFLAKFPGQPVMHKMKVVYMLDAGLTEGAEWNDAESSGVTFSAGYSQYGTLVPAVSNSSAMYKTFTEGYATGAPDPNRLESQKPVSVNNHDGMEYVWIGADDTRFKMWVFTINNRAYAAMVTFGPKLQITMAPQMDAFFADFVVV